MKLNRRPPARQPDVYSGFDDVEIDSERNRPRRALPMVIDLETASWFKILAPEWKRDTRGLSSITHKTTHPAFRAIVGLGPKALPLVLRELQVETDHWFPALKRLSGEDPVPVHLRGNVEEMRRLWLDWGRQKRLIS